MKNWMKVGDSIQYKKNTTKAMTFEEICQQYEEFDTNHTNHTEEEVCKCMFKVLIVDDDKDILDVNKDLMVNLGYSDITLCDSAMSALSLLDNRDFDLIISDYRMPDMNGYQFFKHVQRMENPPVFIMMTAFCTSELKALNQVGVLTVPKPYDIKGLSKVINSFYMNMVKDRMKVG